jgi:hypothetical protein
MKSDHRTHANKVSEFISKMLERFPTLIECKRPTPEKDILFQSDYRHDSNKDTCEDYDKGRVVNRGEREAPDDPVVHYGLITSGSGCDSSQQVQRATDDEDDERYMVVHRGTIASGELVVEDAALRDQLATEYGLLCFEMEAAGALADFPCIVIRGISDYCDSHKNDLWHGYAAAAAAAYARHLFFHMPIDKVKWCVPKATRQSRSR